MFLTFAAVISGLSLKQVNLKELQKSVSRGKPLFAFPADPADTLLLDTLRSLEADYGPSKTFVWYSIDNAVLVGKRYGVSTTSFCFFNRSVLQGAFPIPKSASSWKKIINSASSDIPVPISSKLEFENVLEDEEIDFSLVATRENLGNARFFFYEINRQYGAAQVVCVEQPLLESLNFSASQVAIFRRMDGRFAPITKANLAKAVVPAIRLLTPDVLAREYRPVVALAAPSSESESDGRVRPFLNEMSDRFSGFLFGFWAGDSEVANLSVFSQRRLLSFDISDVFTADLLGKGFNPSAWKKPLEIILEEIEAKSRKPVYISDTPADSSDGPVHRVVGREYQSFVNQNQDVLLLFYSESAVESDAARNVVRAFADGHKGQVFGEIDVSQNSNDFPFIPSLPHIVLFPMRNKTGHQPLRGKVTANNLALLLQHYGTEGSAAEAIPLSREAFRDVVLDTLKRVHELPDDERAKYYAWVNRTAGIPKTTVSGGRNSDSEL
jgi:hypothetical protein